MIIRDLGTQDYLSVWEEMKSFTLNRNEATVDEIWLVEHNQVYTQGQAGDSKHLLTTTDIPVVHTDRGGQITYHGPGQLLMYVLINIRRKNLSPKQLVTWLENSTIATLADYGITATTKAKAPGVYVASGAKIAFVGLRFKKMCSYHGLSLNVNMDLKPFSNINPCGYENLDITHMAAMLQTTNIVAIKNRLVTNAKKFLES